MGRKFARTLLKPLTSLNIGQHFSKYKRQPEPVKPLRDDEDELLIESGSPEHIALDNLSKTRRVRTEAQRPDTERMPVTEKELQILSEKIERLLLKLDASDRDSAPTSAEEELLPRCVICVTSRATMQTFPCSHRVVCRKCFVKTIQMAVNQKLLPLRCIICRAKILKLKQVNKPGPPGTSVTSLPGSVLSVASSSSRYSLGESIPRIPQSTSLDAMPSSTNQSGLYSMSALGRQRLVRHASETFDSSKGNSLRSRKVYYQGTRSCYQLPSPGWSLPSSLPSPCEEDEKDLDDDKSDIDESIITVKQVEPPSPVDEKAPEVVEVQAVVHEAHLPQPSGEARSEFRKEFWNSVVANDPNAKNKPKTKLRHSHSMIIHKEEELKERVVRKGSFRVPEKITTAMVRSESQKLSSLKKSPSTNSIKKSTTSIFRSPSTHSAKQEPSKSSSKQ